MASKEALVFTAVVALLAACMTTRSSAAHQAGRLSLKDAIEAQWRHRHHHCVVIAAATVCTRFASSPNGRG